MAPSYNTMAFLCMSGDPIAINLITIIAFQSTYNAQVEIGDMIINY